MPDETPTLLYDGECGLCSATVELVLRHDRRGTLRFASLQSRYAKRLLAQHPRLEGIDSVIWVEGTRGPILSRSSAGLRVASYLGGVWRLALLMRILPRPIRDWGYDLVARHRHLLFGAKRRCFLPSPKVRHRFLEDEEPPTQAPG